MSAHGGALRAADGGGMSTKIKPGSVVLVDGARCVVLDKAPARVWTQGYGRPHLTPAELVRSMTSSDGKLYRLEPHGGVREDPARDGGTGQRWWVQDAETGELLPYAVRESRMTVVGSTLNPAMLEGVA